MKTLLLLLITLLFTGCVKKSDELRTISSEDKLEIVIIDNCEYYKMRTTYGYMIYSHKGNCNNPIHIYNK